MTADQAQFGMLMKHDQDKMIKLEMSKLVAISGDAGDMSHFIRGEIAVALKSRSANVNLLLGGFDATPSLYWIDHLGSMQKVDKGAHGLSASFILSILDRHHRPDMSLEDAIDLVKLCCNEICLQISPTQFTCRVVDQNSSESKWIEYDL